MGDKVDGNGYLSGLRQRFKTKDVNNINHKNENRNTSLHLLVNAPKIDVNVQNNDLNTALHLAIREGHENIFSLVENAKGINLDIEDKDGDSARTLLAVFRGERSLLEYLHRPYI
ncbi:ankyrin repeat domain-containing protein [Cardinium endosymbiont of Nabis limbatus]|uniref:ankyrin repeat domain-containing protein n=1 Tax=Cardinium endosymbiont of Nabis limbatus TaxID=3066217 RepID=UPI003AF3F1F0